MTAVAIIVVEVASRGLLRIEPEFRIVFSTFGITACKKQRCGDADAKAKIKGKTSPVSHRATPIDKNAR
jgi:hypothetical protein